LRSRSEEELEGEITRATQEVERPTSTVKFAAHLEVADIPVRSNSSLGPSRMSLMDDNGKPSRSGTTLTGTTGTEGMVFGRDAVIEREKINEEARNTFAVMDGWYQDMIQDLIDLDNAFELGLSADSRQEFEEKIQKVRLIKTPPTSKGGKAKVEVKIDEGEPKSQTNDNGTVSKLQLIKGKEADEDLGKPQAIEGKEADKDMDKAVSKDTSITRKSGETASEIKATDSPIVDREKSDIEIIVTQEPEPGDS